MPAFLPLFEEGLQFRMNQDLIDSFTFPDDQHLPSVGFEFSQIRAVALAVSFKLWHPVRFVCARYMRATASAVRMPEAAVNENNAPARGKHEIGASR
jgi:hypothetical protein